MRKLIALIAAIYFVGTALAQQPIQPASVQSKVDRIAESYVKLVMAG